MQSIIVSMYDMQKAVGMLVVVDSQLVVGMHGVQLAVDMHSVVGMCGIQSVVGTMRLVVVGMQFVTSACMT